MSNYEDLRKKLKKGKTGEDYVDNVLGAKTETERPGEKKKSAGSKSKSTLKPAPEEESDESTRATFAVQQKVLEKFKDLCYTQKFLRGKVLYDQKTALQEALELLFKKYRDIEKRPPEIIEAEKRRKKRR